MGEKRTRSGRRSPRRGLSLSPSGPPDGQGSGMVTAATSSEVATATSGEVAKLLHELNVHQAELEAQNEELRAATLRAETLSRRYSELYERAPVAYLTLTRTLGVLEANELARRLLSPSPSRRRPERMSLLSLVDADSGAALGACFDELEAGAERASCELYLDSAQGLRVFQAQVTKRTSDGESEGSYLLALVDLTEQNRLRREVEERKAMLQSMFNAAADAIFVTRGDGQVLDANPRAEEMFGYLREELLGRGIPDLASYPAWRQDVRARWGEEAEAMQLQSGRVLDAQGVRKDGASFPIEVSISSFIKNHHRLFAVYVRDVGPQRLLERQLSHAQKMEAIGTLSSGIAHDFNNILMGIMGCAEVALQRESRDSSTGDLLHDVLSSAVRGAALVRQLLEFGTKRARPAKAIQVDEVLQASEILLRRVIPESIALHVQPHAAEGWIVAEPGQLEQVLVNLAVNARDAMPHGGSLEVGTSLLEFSFREDRRCHRGGPPGVERRHILLPAGAYVVLKVKDDGLGMDRETQARVFEPFFTTKAPGAGSGLGLASVFGIVKRLGGFVDLESSPGRGSSFTFYLPSVRASAVPSTGAVHDALEPARVARAQGLGTALVVEDEPLVLRTAKCFLDEIGYYTLTAENGRAALELSERYSGPIDVLVSDVIMPEMGGLEVASRLLEQRPLLKVLFMSGNERDDLVQRGLLRDTDVVLQKPFSGSDLASCVQRLTGRSNAVEN